ncbi:unnamed protein product [Caenorhabditis bovis]|uniref:DUF19 domain-containing protein n=1 Tax=Caenorhabditis bovis TaxID=2654633 RepID=A0A8S1EF07_9PELO|nr:unnamed protein product [Caenorhabditis bovis]
MSRARRSYFEDFRPNSPACEVVCEAQWKSEFHLNFQRLYDTQYFEVPLDPTITKSKANLKLFCQSTRQKTSWSPEKHVCLGQLENFERNINCLSLTDRYVQRDCNNVCNNLRIEISPNEEEVINELKLTRPERNTLVEQNEHCHFISCHQMCHEYIINKVCIDSAAAARSLVKNYYDAYLEREHASLKKNDHDELFSSFCRRVTPNQNENAYAGNMTQFNNDILDRMKGQIREIFSKLDKKTN